jgi:DedD protein
LKRRIIGATVLVALLVIFVPMLVERPKAPTAASPAQAPTEVPRPSHVISLHDQNESVRPAPGRDAPLPPMVDNPPAASASVRRDHNAEHPVTRPSKPLPEAPSITARPAPEQRAVEIPRPAAQPRAPAMTAGAQREPLAIPAGASWVVQLGAFSHRGTAIMLAERLRQRGYPAFVQDMINGGEKLFRVRVGPQADRQASDALRRRLEQETQMKAIVSHYP